MKNKTGIESFFNSCFYNPMCLSLYNIFRNPYFCGHHQIKVMSAFLPINQFFQSVLLNSPDLTDFKPGKLLAPKQIVNRDKLNVKLI